MDWQIIYDALISGSKQSIRELLIGEKDPAQTLREALIQIKQKKPQLTKRAKLRISYWARRYVRNNCPVLILESEQLEIDFTNYRYYYLTNDFTTEIAIKTKRDLNRLFSEKKTIYRQQRLRIY